MKKYQSKPHGGELYETMNQYYLKVSRSQEAKTVTNCRRIRKCDNQMQSGIIHWIWGQTTGKWEN